MQIELISTSDLSNQLFADRQAAPAIDRMGAGARSQRPSFEAQLASIMQTRSEAATLRDRSADNRSNQIQRESTAAENRIRSTRGDERRPDSPANKRADAARAQQLDAREADRQSEATEASRDRAEAARTPDGDSNRSSTTSRPASEDERSANGVAITHQAQAAGEQGETALAAAAHHGSAESVAAPADSRETRTASAGDNEVAATARTPIEPDAEESAVSVAGSEAEAENEARSRAAGAGATAEAVAEQSVTADAEQSHSHGAQAACDQPRATAKTVAFTSTDIPERVAGDSTDVEPLHTAGSNAEEVAARVAKSSREHPAAAEQTVEPAGGEAAGAPAQRGEGHSAANVAAQRAGETGRPELVVIDLRDRAAAETPNDSSSGTGPSSVDSNVVDSLKSSGSGGSNADTSGEFARFFDADGFGGRTGQIAGRTSGQGGFEGLRNALFGQLRESGNAEIVRQAQIVLRGAENGEIRLMLKPESLGNVRFNLTLQDGHIGGRIIVENTIVKDVFEQNLGDLLRAFEEQGLETGSLEVSVADSGNKRNRHGGDSGSRTAARHLEQAVPIVYETQETYDLVNLVV